MISEIVCKEGPSHPHMENEKTLLEELNSIACCLTTGR